MVYISDDLYRVLVTTLGGTMRYGAGVPTMGNSIISINTSVGSVNVKTLNRLRNFLLVGRKEDLDILVNAGIDPMFWNDQEKQRVDGEFEKSVLENE